MKSYKLHPFPLTLKVRKAPLEEGPVACTSFFGSEVEVVLSPEATSKECCHEAVHVVQAVEMYIETKLDNETQAYLTAHVFEKLCRCL